MVVRFDIKYRPWLTGQTGENVDVLAPSTNTSFGGELDRDVR